MTFNTKQLEQQVKHQELSHTATSSLAASEPSTTHKDKNISVTLSKNHLILHLSTNWGCKIRAEMKACWYNGDQNDK